MAPQPRTSQPKMGETRDPQKPRPEGERTGQEAVLPGKGFVAASTGFASPAHQVTEAGDRREHKTREGRKEPLSQITYSHAF